MIIKTLFENYNLDLTSILYKHISELELTFDEVNILNSLMYYSRDKKAFYLKSFIKQINASKNWVEDQLSSLVQKDLIKIESISDGTTRIREVLNFDVLFEKLTKIIENEATELTEENLKKINEFLEKHYQRTLNSMEISEMKNLFYNHFLTFSKAKQIIESNSDMSTFSIFAFRNHLLNGK